MLKRFAVENFACFKSQLVFDLGTPNSYEYNSSLIKNGIVNKGIVIGENAAGKTKLGYALLDLTYHLTDTAKKRGKSVFLNPFSELPFATFEYLFDFDGNEVRYIYRKTSRTDVVYEELHINERLVIINSPGNRRVELKGTEYLNMPEQNSSMSISLVKYVFANTIPNMDDLESRVFVQFMEFVQNMIWFSSTEGNRYIGSESVFDGSTVFEVILKMDGGDAKPLENFLRKYGIEYDLVPVEDVENSSICCKMNEKLIPLQILMSSGTKSLVFLYLWYRQMQRLSFVYIDEFDAFYHTDLSRKIFTSISEIKEAQVIFSTHNTDLISNEFLRPDCIFQIRNNTIATLSDSTDRALREAHNLQKMYKAGAFNER